MEINAKNNDLPSLNISNGAITGIPVKIRTTPQGGVVSDSLKLNPLLNAKEPPKKPEKSALTSFGEKMFNQPVLNNYLAYREKPAYMPIVAQVDRAISEGANIRKIELTAVKATQSLYPDLSPEKTLLISYRSILASAIHNRYSDPSYFNGERDKIFHYFVSGAMTLKTHESVSILPASVAGKAVLTLGWVKEVASIPGNGYGSDDMRANTDGINSALRNLENLKKYKTI